MSNLLTPVEPQILEAVTGGATATSTSTATSRCTTSSSSDQVLATLTSLSNTIKNLGNNNNGGFSMTEALMLGLLLNQRSQVNVFVRRPFW